MTCHEVQTLADAYLDSELESTVTHQIASHLAGCASCARWLEERHRSENRLAERLRVGVVSDDLWRRLEQQAVVQFAAKRGQAMAAEGAEALRACEQAAVRSWWLDLLWPNPKFYAALAALWAVLLTVNATLPGPSDEPTRHAPASARETRRALVEKRRQVNELMAAFDEDTHRNTFDIGKPRSEHRGALNAG